MFCTGCGNMLKETDIFCKVCGTKNLYYSEDMQSFSKGQALPQSPIYSGEEQAEEIRTDNRSGRQEAAVIQPEIVILPVEQMGQSQAAGEMPQLEAGNVIIKQASDLPIKPKKPLKEVGRGAKVASVFLSILAFLLMMLFDTSLFAKSTLSQKSLEASIQKIDYTEVELGDFLADSDMEIEVSEGDTTVDVVYEALSEQGRVDISRGDVEEIFEETSFTEYLSEKLSAYARYAVTGEEPDEITPREIVRLVEDNKEIIEDTAGLEITEEDLEKLENYLKEDSLLESISLEKIDQTLEENKADRIRVFFSDTMLMVIIIVSLLLLIGDIALISYLHRRIKAPLSYIGIPVMTGGVLFTITLVIINILKPRLLSGAKGIYSSIKPVVSSILMKGVLIGLATAMIGILMVAAYILMKKLQNREEAQINQITTAE